MSIQLAERAAGDAVGVSTLGGQSIIGRSPDVLEAVELARNLATLPGAAVFLTGEAGTGKELLARGIHYAGAGADEPFLSVSCAATPDHLLGPEIFGVQPRLVPGAPLPRRGLLELAGGGSVFIDELTRIPLPLQAELLRAVEARVARRTGGDAPIPVRCRVVLATTVLPDVAVARGDLHPGLAATLWRSRVDLPPLRDRGGDVELLAQYFLHLLAGEQGFAVKRLEEGALAALAAHAWPGNVRELKYVVERAVMLAEGPTVRGEHLIVQHRTARSGASAVPAAAEIRIPPAGKPLEEIEAEAIALTLRLTGGNQSAAARILHISRPTLARKLREHGLRER